MAAQRAWLRFSEEWLRYKKASDDEIADVLALMNWPDMRKHERWAKRYGEAQIKASAYINANVTLAVLRLQRKYSTAGACV